MMLDAPIFRAGTVTRGVMPAYLLDVSEALDMYPSIAVYIEKAVLRGVINGENVHPRQFKLLSSRNKFLRGVINGENVHPRQ